MSVTESFLEFVLEQLDAVGPITSKRMFGGVGLYAGDCFFAVLMNDTLYLKVDDASRGKYEAAGSRKFNPYPGRSGSMQYFEAPPSVLEDGGELARWARVSIAVAQSQQARRPKAAVKPARPHTRSKPLSSAEKLAARRKASRRSS